ncbi:MAG: ATP-binding protein [Bradyrhizobium sp.]|jgi:light-regulated signal transduction histidine kinase (bacteriophytochrome)
MSDLEERPPRVGVKRTLARWDLELHKVRSPILRYGLSAACVAIAFGLALTFQYYQFRDVEVPVFTLSIAIVTWYAGNGPSVLAVLLSMLLFDYFFIEPRYSFDISSRELPYFFTFVTWGIIVASFAAVRRRTEDGLRRAQEELATRAAELETANKELESFTYSVSHDLRAPLRHVVGYAELLQKQSSSVLDDKARRYMAMILEASKRMGSLIDDLLSFSRLGRAEARKTAVNLNQLVREVIAELGQDTKDRDISWTIGALPVCYGDRSMLKLVLANLLSNAVKFTRIRPRAKIEIGCGDRKDNQVEVFVADNGAGFEMQYVNKLFGVFQRLHRAEEFEGTGIGLATVERIIHRHGGTVRAEGVLDQGATFYFSLPRP